MPFLLFEKKSSSSSLEIPPLACNELITKIDHDFPSYVHQLPCIYDVIDRKCYDGEDACVAFLSTFSAPDPEPVVVDVVAPEHQVVEQETTPTEPEPKKKASRARKQPKKSVVV